MRRLAFLLCAAALSSAVLPVANAWAQQTKADREEQQKRDQEKNKAEKEKQKKANKLGAAPLDQQVNAGPCPYVKALYDAARYVEFDGGKEAAATVGWTGEIESVHSNCSYKSDQPIRVTVDVSFALGKGPKAEGAAKRYRYWVAVTDRNKGVIAKEDFELPVSFPAGADRVATHEVLNDIVIPRATSKVSGDNFEVLVGFEVTPAMAEFNRQGKRFRVNSGTSLTADATGKPAGQ